MSLKLVTNSDSPTFMSFVDVYEKLMKLWELRDLVAERELTDELPSLERSITHYESLAQFQLNKFENDKLNKTKDILKNFNVDYTETTFEAHSILTDIFGSITMIHPVDSDFNLMFVHGLVVEDNFNEKQVSFMMALNKNEPFVTSIDTVTKNFKYLCNLKTYFNADSEFHVLTAIDQVCEYSSNKPVPTTNTNESSNVIECSQLFLDRQKMVAKNRSMNNLVSDVVNLTPPVMIPIIGSSEVSFPMSMSPNEEMIEILEEMKQVLCPTDDAG